MDANKTIENEAEHKGPQYWEEALAGIFVGAHQLAIRKQMAYGKGNIGKFGLQGVVVRMTDKLERATNLVMSGRKPDPALAESLADTFIDLINYAGFALMLMNGSWGLPMESIEGRKVEEQVAQAQAEEEAEVRAEVQEATDAEKVGGTE